MMKSQHSAMTIDEFHQMPRKLGWKYEYWNGQAHISPQRINVVAANVPVEPRPVVSACEIRAVTEQDRPKLLHAYIAGFRDTIDYCDYSLASLKSAAVKDVENYFAGNRGIPLAASQVAVSRGRIVGAALIVEKTGQRCLLNLLFVRPSWQRKSIATALVATALNVLYQEGRSTLSSRYLLGNEQSRAWHKRFGFVDETDGPLARAYYYTMSHNVDLLRSKGKLSEEENAEYAALLAYWQEQSEKLEGVYSAFDWR